MEVFTSVSLKQFCLLVYVAMFSCMYIALSISVLAFHYCGLFPDPFRLNKMNIRLSNCQSAANAIFGVLKSRLVLKFLDPTLFLVIS